MIFCQVVAISVLLACIPSITCLSCAPNYEFRGDDYGKCYPKSRCPSGYKLDVVDQKCHRISEQCPEVIDAYSWPSLMRPVAEGFRRCPPGMRIEQGRCVFLEPMNVACPPGFVLVNGLCQRHKLECPRNYILEGNQCVYRSDSRQTIVHEENNVVFRRRR